jgi:hypothetical protein
VIARNLSTGRRREKDAHRLGARLNGKLVKTLLTAPRAQRKHWRLRGKIKKNKIDDFEKWAESLVESVRSCMAPSPGEVMDFVPLDQRPMAVGRPSLYKWS